MQSTNVIFPAPNQVAVQVEAVRAPGPGEILCEAEVSLISTGTETYCLRGVFDPGTNWADWVKFPFYPGYSMSARVAAVGEGVAGLRVGQRIAAGAPHQQRFVMPARQAIVVPEGIEAETACWMLLAVTTQLGVRRAQVELGESVGVVGLGLLGQLVVQYLALSGTRQVVAIDTVPSRLALAAAHGATQTLAMNAQAARAAVAELTGGRMLDAVIEVTGHPAALAPSIQLVRRLGRVVLLGDTPTPSQQPLGPGVVSNSVSILGIHGSQAPETASEYAPWSQAAIAELFFDFVRQGRMRVNDLITERCSPLEAPRLYERLVSDRANLMAMVFDWTHSEGLA